MKTEKNLFLSILFICLVSQSACRPPATIPTATPTSTISTNLTPTLVPEVEAYLESALDIMQEYSYYRATINWGETRAFAQRLALNAERPADIYNVITYILKYELKDRHGYLMPPEQAEEYAEADISDSPQPEGLIFEEQYAYLNIPMFASGNPDVVSAYATQLQDLIRQLDAGNPCGWVVDLRSNHGGNMWAMLVGLGPLLGEGALGAFDYGNNITETWSYIEGSILEGDEVVIKIAGPAYHLNEQDAPVALLTGWDTLSSGEAVAVAFRGRPETRSFGKTTGGYTTAIELFPLEDGAMLGITTALFADRAGNIYSGPITPDEPISTSMGVQISDSVSIPEAALDWLVNHPACLNP